MSRKIYSHTSCTLDITTLNKHAADSQMSVLFMQETNPSRPHGVTSHNTTSLTFTNRTANVMYSSHNTWQIKLIMQQCLPPPHQKKILPQCLHQFVGITSLYGIFLIHQLDASTMPSCNEGINYHQAQLVYIIYRHTCSYTVCISYISSGQMMRSQHPPQYTPSRRTLQPDDGQVGQNMSLH